MSRKAEGTAHIRGYGADAYRVNPAVAEYAGFTSLTACHCVVGNTETAAHDLD